MRTPPSRTSERFPPRGVTGNQNKSSVHARPGQPVNLVPGSASYSYTYNVNRFQPFQIGGWCQAFFMEDSDSFGPEVGYWQLGPGPTAFWIESNEPAHQKNNQDTFDTDNALDIFGGDQEFTLFNPPGPPWLAPAGAEYFFGEYQETSSTDTIGGGTGTTNNVTSFADPHNGAHAPITYWYDPTTGIVYRGDDLGRPPGLLQVGWDGWTAPPPGDFSGPAKAEIADTMGFRITFDRFGRLQIFIDPGWLYWATTKLTFYTVRIMSGSLLGDPFAVEGSAFSNGYFFSEWVGGYVFDRNLPVDWFRFGGAGQNNRLQSFSPVSRGGDATMLMTDQFQNFPFDVPSFSIPVTEQTVVAKSVGYSGNITNLNEIVLSAAANASPPDTSGSLLIFPLRLEIDISGLKIPDWLIARLPLVVRNAGFQAI